MIYVFLGKEINILKSKMDSLISELGINNIIKFDYGDINFIDIINEVNYVDLFNEKKLIIVSSFSFKKLKENDEKNFMNYIDHMNDNVIILNCIDDSLDKRKSLISKIYDKCKVVECVKLKYGELVEYASNMFKEAKISATEKQIKKIISLCENDTDRVINEIKKVILYKSGSDMLLDIDIDECVKQSTDRELFRLVDAVVDKKIAESFEAYNTLIELKVDPSQIVSVIADRFRLMLQIKVLSKSNSMKAIGYKFGYENRMWALEGIYEQTSKYSENEIASKIEELHEVDINVKGGSDARNEAVEQFLINL